MKRITSKDQSRAGTFERAPGIANTDGPRYESKVTALLWLIGFNSGVTFQMAANVPGAGALDDIVFRIFCLTKWYTYFIQLKHTIRKISRQALSSEKGDFSLIKYSNSYLTVKETMSKDEPPTIFKGCFENCSFVLYTCAELSKDVQKVTIDRSNDVLDILKTGSAKEKILGFNEKKSSDICSCFGEVDEDKKEFLKRFQIFSGEPNVKEIDEIIIKEICKKYTNDKHEAELVCTLFVDEIEKWGRESNVILDQDSDILKRAFSRYRVGLLESQQRKDINPYLKFKEEPLTVLNKSLSQSTCFLNIYVEEESFITLSCHKLLQTLEKTNKGHIFISLDCLLKNADEVLTVWKYDEKNTLAIIDRSITGNINHDTTLTVVNEICTILESVDNKQVVYLSQLSESNDFNEIFEEKLGKNFQKVKDNWDLTQVKVESLEIMLNTQVVFQGHPMKIRDILHINLQEITPLIQRLLVYLVPQAVIGHKLNDPINFYIDRTLVTAKALKKEIFGAQELVGTCAVSGVTKEELQKLLASSQLGREHNRLQGDASQKSRFVVLDPNNSEHEYKDLCSKSRCVHWLNMDKGTMTWKRSHGNIDEIIPYIDRELETTYSPHSFLDMDERIVLLLAKPGMGKSTVIAYLAYQTKDISPSHWVVRLNLGDYTSPLNRDKGNVFRPDEFLANAACHDTTSQLEKALFQHNVKYCGNKMVVLLDGYDELNESCMENAERLLTHLLESNICRVWVASRFSMEKQLTRMLSTISHSLKPFTSDDQKRFLERFWSNVKSPFTTLEKTKFIQKLLQMANGSMSADEIQLTGIPLQTRMLAEEFQSHIMDPFQNPLPAILDVLNLYERFVDEKYKILKRDKFKIACEQEYVWRVFQRDSFTNHTYSALLLILNKVLLRKLGISNIENLVKDFLNDVCSADERTGIIDKITDGKPHFIHRTFAEYFVGKWIANNIDKIDCFQSILYTEDFLVIRSIFDRVLTRSSALHTAVLNRNVIHLKALLSEGADVNSVDKGGRTAAHIVAASRSNTPSENNLNLEILNILLEYDTDITLKDTKLFRWTPLKYADETSSFGVVDLLLSQNEAMQEDLIKTKTYFKSGSILNEVIENDLANVLSFGFDCGLSENVDCNYQHYVTGKIIHKASMHGSSKVIQLLLSRGLNSEGISFVQHLVNKKDSAGATSLHYASEFGHEETLNLLIDNGANVNALSNYKQSPLHYAAIKGHLRIVQLLIDHGADVNVVDDENQSSLHYAVKNGHERIVQLLIDRGADVNVVDNGNQSSLQYAVIYGHERVVQLLIDHGANVHVINDMRQSNLHYAAITGHVGIVQLLIDRGADVNVISVFNQSPLHIAVENCHVEIVQLLIDSGADIHANNKYQSPLQYAAENGHFEIFQLLIENGAGVNSVDEGKITLLHYATKGGNKEIVHYLLRHGSNLNAIDTNGNTPLHCAARGAHIEAVNLLIDEGANVHLLNKFNDSVLHCAAACGNADIVKLFINSGIDVNLLNFKNKTPLHFACESGNANAVLLLVEAGADVYAVDKWDQTPLHYGARSRRVEAVRALLSNFPDDSEQRTAYVNQRNRNCDTAITMAQASNNFRRMFEIQGIVELLKEFGAIE